MHQVEIRVQKLCGPSTWFKMTTPQEETREPGKRKGRSSVPEIKVGGKKPVEDVCNKHRGRCLEEAASRSRNQLGGIWPSQVPGNVWKDNREHAGSEGSMGWNMWPQ